MTVESCFQPHQIVYLEHQGDRLYAEVIQVVPARRLCWARPLVLVTASECTPFSDLWHKPASYPAVMHDLRESSDLLLPLSLFHLALDTEVLPLLGYIYSTEPLPDKVQAAQQSFRQFVAQVCLTLS